jgi:aminopeptidase N
MQGQDRRPAIDVESYKIDLKLDPAAGSMTATAQVTFSAVDDKVNAAVFELAANLEINSITDASGRTLQASRTVQDFLSRVSLPEPMAKGAKTTLTFQYGGKMTGDEEGTVPGIKFAALLPDRAWLLYPSRWFPVSGYAADRYTMELNVTVPPGFRAVSSGIELTSGQVTTFRFTGSPGFPGSLALVKESATKASAQGVNSIFYFTPGRAAAVKAFGDEAANVLTYLTTLFGIPPVATMTYVETGPGAPDAYSAPGVVFIAPNRITEKPSQRLLANQLTRQWFGNLVGPATRNHIWIANGVARYAEIMYQEHLNGPGVLEAEIRDLYVDAMTVTDAPVLQAARFEDYSPELLAVTGSKAAATLHMLRWAIGDENLIKTYHALTEKFAGGAITTADFRRAAETASGQNLQGFFIQWLESTGAPEFQMTYTVYRTQKGFRVMGKISQDLDTFRMPVELRIETEGNPEDKRVDVMGPSTDFSVDSFGKPKRVIIDPNGRLLRLSPNMRVAVAIRRGEQAAEVGDYPEALKEYQRALEVTRISSLAHYRVAEVFFLQGNYQSAANEFREALSGDLEPKWTEVWSHINLGKIFDITGQRERAINEYTLAIRTKDNTQGAQEEAAKYRQAPYQRQEK